MKLTQKGTPFRLILGLEYTGFKPTYQMRSDRLYS